VYLIGHKVFFGVRASKNELVVTCAREAIVTLIHWRTTHDDSTVKR
jgi:hypothetical protein